MDNGFGIVGCAVGASFAVLIAEQLFVSGRELLVSVASAGQIADLGPPPYHIVIDRALRDEGTSYHYLPPSQFVGADRALLALADEVLVGAHGKVLRCHMDDRRSFPRNGGNNDKRRRDESWR